MTIFFDTNVILDILDDTRDCHEKALSLLTAAKKGAFQAHTTTQSFIDASYIQTQQRKLPIDLFRSAVSLLSGILSVEAITADDLAKANKSTIPDYEDSAQVACAERIQSDYIITRDGKYKDYTHIPTFNPIEFYDKLFQG